MSYVYVNMYTSVCLYTYVYAPTYSFISLDAHRRLSAFLKSLLAYAAAWHVSVPLVLFFLVSSNPFFTPLVRGGA